MEGSKSETRRRSSESSGAWPNGLKKSSLSTSSWTWSLALTPTETYPALSKYWSLKLKPVNKLWTFNSPSMRPTPTLFLWGKTKTSCMRGSPSCVAVTICAVSVSFPSLVAVRGVDQLTLLRMKCATCVTRASKKSLSLDKMWIHIMIKPRKARPICSLTANTSTLTDSTRCLN